jgi:periplasmic protein TonB
MPHDLFGNALVRSARPPGRRRFLTIVSIAVHAVAISAIVVVQLFAIGPLPMPRSVLEFETPRLVKLAEIDVPRPRSSTPGRAAVSPNAAPVVAPSGVTEETGLENAHVTNITPGMVVGVEQGGGVGLVDLGAIERIAPPPPPAPTPPMRLHSGMTPPRKVVDVNPVYPQLAQTAHAQGIVILEAIIDAQGNVSSVHVLRSIPLLDQAAVDAVRQWRYTPALLNGTPVPVVMTVTVNFQLNR